MGVFDPLPDLWDDAVAPTDPVDQLVYRSRLLGADLRVTNYAGGNTSSKTAGTDPVTASAVGLLWVKGSGGDLGTLTREGLACLDVDRVRGLERTFRGVAFEDEQLALLPSCIVLQGAPPSIDTPLHAWVDAGHVDHVHPDALIAFATAKDGRALVHEVFGDEIGWLEWQRPGYDLGLKLRDLQAVAPGCRGVVLGGHGLVTWAGSARDCYRLTIQVINRAAEYIASRAPGAPFGSPRQAALDQDERRRQAARMMPVLRGALGEAGAAAGLAHFRDDPEVLEFAGSDAAARLVAEGTSCPDHFLRTKRSALLLDIAADREPAESRELVAAAFDGYREGYQDYYRAHAQSASPPMRDPSPALVLWPGVGMFSFGRTAAEARIVGEFYVNAINVMRGAETLGGYRGLPESEAFAIEYWDLEEAKLRRMPPEKPLSRRVALVTGGAGGIGAAIARRFVAEGAAVVIADLDLAGAQAIAAEIGEQALALRLDVTEEASVEEVFTDSARHFGGIDLVVNNAGITVGKPVTETSLEEYERVHRVVDAGSFLVSRAFARQSGASGLGGDIIYIVSKNAVFAGPDNAAYGSAKAAQLHQMRLLAAELAPLGIRVNGVNPDAVIQGSKLFAGDWGRERAERYGVPVEQLGEYYAQRSLLGLEILPEDIADACFALVSGLLAKTTGCVIPVDSGVAAAFLR
ncbi:MAG TPA: bifunctional rhamnulose-1-phosphate aldolase/short-chain dehydrogenase [Candidatus Solibacter sp.]|nr:bifunctional rhamnulose-1-phosphate aldolase/short-chain dehydrogenase [Candidatus Solibacter sp.]